MTVAMQPLANVEWVDPSSLHANGWNPNRVMKPELRLLEHSIMSTGWVQPILAATGGQIIDGFHRWRLSQDSVPVRGLTDSLVPVVFLDVTEPQAMLMTVRMNRAKGAHVAVSMASLVKELIVGHGLTVDDVRKGIGASKQEVELLMQESVFTERGIADHAYSKAWYPVRTP